MKLKNNDPTDKYGIVRVTDYFPFRKHVVLVFELLGVNLYKCMKNENFQKFSKSALSNLTA